MPESLYLGLDGGGTGCRAVLATAEGDIIGRGVGGPANSRSVGVETAWRHILTAVSGALEQGNLLATDMQRVHACFGLAGVGRMIDREAFMGLPHPFASLRLETDIHVALAGAIGREQGALLVAGTGSIAYGVDAAGERYRVGGWGFVVGDEGSGAWLGREAVRAVLAAADGRELPTALSETILRAWGPDVDDLMACVREAGPAQYAELAPAVLALAKEGDGVAKRLRLEAVAALRLLLETLEHRLPPGDLRFSLMGGVALALREDFLMNIPPRLAQGYLEAQEQPEVGALRLAGREKRLEP